MSDTADTPQQAIRALIQKVATGSEMSRNLSRVEALTGMRLVLDGQVPDVQAAVFLIGLRMKRETADELAGMLDGLLEQVNSVTVDCEQLVDMADIYNGYTRYLPIAPFLPPLLAACGISTVCHGLHDLGPKHGLTLHRVYDGMGIDVSLSPQQTAEHVSRIGWGYVDQACFAPRLHRLLPLRNLIVKRTGLHTLEGLCRPVRATGHNHLLTGYVHTNYLAAYTRLSQQAGFQSALIVRGIEGGSLALPTRQTLCAAMDATTIHRTFEVTPEEAGIKQKTGLERCKGTSAHDLEQTVHFGKLALRGKDSPFTAPLQYAAAQILQSLNKANNLIEGRKMAEEALKTGQALAKLEACSG